MKVTLSIPVELTIETSGCKDKKKLLQAVRQMMIGKSQSDCIVGSVAIKGIKHINDDRPRVPCKI